MKEDMDRLLKTTLRNSTAPPTDACVDAEQLAAWSAGALGEAEALSVEQHLSNCPRCQAVMATLVRSESAVSVAPASPRTQNLEPRTSSPPRVRRWSPAWLIPLAAAAALVVWISLPTRQSSDTSAPAVARVEQPVAAPVEPVAPPSTPDAAQPAPVAPPGASEQAARSRANAQSQLQSKSARTAPREPATKAAAEAAPPPAAAPVPAPVAPASAQAARASGASAPAAASAPSAPPGSTADALSARAASPAVTVAGESPAASFEIVSATRPLQQPRVGSGAGRGGGVVAALAAPPPPIRWRVVQPGRVERSTNGGTSWEAAAINPADPPVVLTGGASPSPFVCWLVGRGGVVLLTLDGLRFDRVSLPDAVDLSAIQAVDGRQATVTAADGRTFTTTDAGRTWR